MSEQDDNRKKQELNADLELSSKYAVALGYDMQKNSAPVVLAKGQGQIAEKIIQIALDNNIEIRRGGNHFLHLSAKRQRTQRLAIKKPGCVRAFFKKTASDIFGLWLPGGKIFRLSEPNCNQHQAMLHNTADCHQAQLV